MVRQVISVAPTQALHISSAKWRSFANLGGRCIPLRSCCCRIVAQMSNRCSRGWPRMSSAASRKSSLQQGHQHTRNMLSACHGLHPLLRTRSQLRSCWTQQYHFRMSNTLVICRWQLVETPSQHRQHIKRLPLSVSTPAAVVRLGQQALDTILHRVTGVKLCWYVLQELCRDA